jgi:hypothetical protein
MHLLLCTRSIVQLPARFTAHWPSRSCAIDIICSCVSRVLLVSDSCVRCNYSLVIPSSMSRFWAGRDDQSASESESDSGSDSSAAAAKKGQKERRQWALDSDSESEDEVRVVKSAKDRCMMRYFCLCMCWCMYFACTSASSVDEPYKSMKQAR